MVDIVKGIKSHNDIMHSRRVKNCSPEALKADLLIEKDYKTLQSKIHPLSDKAHAEFFAKELEHTTKQCLTDFVPYGFFLISSDTVMHQRSVFKEIFHFDRLAKFMPKIRSLSRKHVARVKKLIQNSPDKKIQINVKHDILLSLFEDISTYIIFRDDLENVEFNVFGKSFAAVAQQEFQHYMNLGFSLLNSFTSGYALKMGLLKDNTEFKKLREELKKQVAIEYAKREAAYQKNPTDREDEDVFTIIIKHNEKQRKLGQPEMTMEEITGNLELFQFAANDTSYQTSNGFLAMMALNPEVQSQLRTLMRGIDNDYAYPELDNIEVIGASLSETLRLTSVSSVLTTREIVKPMKVCGVKLKVGDSVSVYPAANNFREDIFPEPRTFDPNRFVKGAKTDMLGNAKTYPKINRNLFIPFSTGGRNCIGQYLGELMVKVVVTEFIKEFEFSPISEDWTPHYGIEPIYSIINSDLMLEIAK